MRDLTKSLISSSWRLSMSGVEQVTKAMVRPLTSLLANQGGSFRSATTTAEQQIDSAFQATVRVGDEVQRRTVDLMFDLFTLTPFVETLESSGLIGKDRGYQKQPELEYLEVMNDAGPAKISLPVIVLAVMYANLNREEQGIERFDKYLSAYGSSITPSQKAAYLSLVSLLRISRVQKLPVSQFLDSISLLQRGLAGIKEAKDITANEPDPSEHNKDLFENPPGKLLARWVSGIVNTGLPWPLGNREVALEDLKWCEQVINKSMNVRKVLYLFLLEIYYNLALLYDKAGDDKEAKKYLQRAGFERFDKKIFIASAYGTTHNGLRDGLKHLTESIPGKVFTISGHDMPEFNFIISDNGKEMIAIDCGAREDTVEAAYNFFKEHVNDRIPELPPLTTVFITHAHFDHVAGHPFYSRLNPNVKFYSRQEYPEEQERSANLPPPYKWYLGVTFKKENVASYKPDFVVTEGAPKHHPGEEDPAAGLTQAPYGFCPPPIFYARSQGTEIPIPTAPSADYPALSAKIEVGGTKVELILPPGGGGETPDGMLIYLSDYSVVYGGDFFMPYIGVPYIVEGSLPALIANCDILGNYIKPKHILCGHEAITNFYGNPEVLSNLKPHLEWLYCEVLKLINDYELRTTILERNLIPPGITEQPSTQIPFLIVREGAISRTYSQRVGYWGPKLQNVDYLTQEELGAALAHHFRMSEQELVDGIKRMMRSGDLELAGRIVNWAVTQYPDSEELKQVRRQAFLLLKQKWQQLSVFKFVMYSEEIADETPIVGNEF